MMARKAFVITIFCVFLALQLCPSYQSPTERRVKRQDDFEQLLEDLFGETRSTPTSTTIRLVSTTIAPLATTPREPDPACVRRCINLPQYSPVCGTDGITYNNESILNCAVFCGLSDLTIRRRGRCPEAM